MRARGAALLLVAAAGGAAGRRAFHDTADGQLHYVVRGGAPGGRPREAEPPALLFLHSDPVSSDEFTEVMELLCGDAQRRCVAVDFFGLGHSDPAARTNITLDDYAGYVWGILRSVGVERFVPFGSLTGGHVGLQMALTHGARSVPRLVLHAIPYFFPDVLPQARHFIGLQRNNTPAANGSHLLDGWNGDNGRLVPRDPSRVWLHQRMAIDVDRAFQHHWLYEWSCDLEPNGDVFEQRMRALEVPTLMLWSDGHLDWADSVYLKGHDQAKFIPTLPRNGTAVIVRDAGPCLLQENASTVVDIVNDFLR